MQVSKRKCARWSEWARMRDGIDEKADRASETYERL